MDELNGIGSEKVRPFTTEGIPFGRVRDDKIGVTVGVVFLYG